MVSYLLGLKLRLSTKNVKNGFTFKNEKLQNL